MAVKNLRDIHQEWIKIFETQEVMTIPTGIEILDKKLVGGFRPHQLIMIGGNPTTGKTSFALQITHNMAIVGHKILWYSFEMGEDLLYERLISRCYSIPYTNVINRQFSEQEKQKIYAMGLQGWDNIYFGEANSDFNRLKLQEDLISIDKMADPKKPFVVVIDYLQKLPDMENGKHSNRDVRQRVDRNLAVFRDYLKTFNCSFLVVSSVNREGMKKGEMGLSSFKESGDIEFSGDVTITMGVAKDSRDKDTGNTIWEVCNEREFIDQQTQMNVLVLFGIPKIKHSVGSNMLLMFNKQHQHFTHLSLHKGQSLSTMPINQVVHGLGEMFNVAVN